MRKIKTYQLFPSAVITDTCSFLVGFINLSVENVCTNFTNSFILSGRFYISLRKINIRISGFHDIHDEHKTVTQQEIILVYLHVSKIVNIYNSNCHLAMTKCLVRCTMLLVLKEHEDEFPIDFFPGFAGMNTEEPLIVEFLLTSRGLECFVRSLFRWWGVSKVTDLLLNSCRSEQQIAHHS